jgi:hypothetical protein
MKTWIVLGLMLSAPAYAGGAVGNGGDSVNCTPNAAISPFSGWYNLDYLINKTSEVEFSEDFEKSIAPDDSYDKNIQRILKAFQESGYSVLYQDLKEFYEGWGSPAYGQRYQWEKAPYGLVKVDDENLRQRIPPNCLGQTAGNSVIQTVLRTEKVWEMRVQRKPYPFQVKGATYTYSTEVVSHLSSLQLSFLLFHEWLRNFTDDPEKIRDANAIFHSPGWSGDDVDRKLDILKGLRIDLLTDLRIAK